MKQRVSNFEVIRILSMLMIVFLHVNTHYKPGDESLYQLPHMFMYLQMLSEVCVNLFIMITGYFMVTSTRKMTSWFKLFFQVSFFALIISGIIMGFGIEPFGIKTVIKNALPILFDRYWFVTMYAILYLITPYLNFFLNNAGKDASFSFIFILFAVGCVWQPTFGVENIGFGRGYYLISFIFLYLLSGYIRKYDEFVIHFKRPWMYFALFFGMGLFSAIVYQLTENPVYTRYNHWTTVIMTYALFMGFKTMKPFVNKPINAIAKNVFGVYLVHEHPMIRKILHNSTTVDNILTANAPYFTLRALGFGLLVFVGSLVAATVLNMIYNALFAFLQPRVARMWHAWAGE